MEKITYPNEYTYQPPLLDLEVVNQIEDENGFVRNDWRNYDADKRNGKKLTDYLTEWHKKISDLRLYGMNNILGDVWVYVNKDNICVEVTSNISYSDNMGGEIKPQEGYRKKLVGKHITTIRNIFHKWVIRISTHLILNIFTIAFA